MARAQPTMHENLCIHVALLLFGIKCRMEIYITFTMSSESNVHKGVFVVAQSAMVGTNLIQNNIDTIAAVTFDVDLTVLLRL